MTALDPKRRSLLGSLGTLLALPWLGLSACHRREPLIRIGAHVWPGYELLYLARNEGAFDDRSVRLVELPSATDSLLGLASGSLDGACLTLDEVLMARAQGVPLRVVAVLDVSLGADALLVRPGLNTLAALRGKRIGVENNAVGGLMLDGILRAANLAPSDLRVVFLTGDQHLRAYAEGRIDGVVTFEPTQGKLEAMGAHVLFDSTSIPDRIVDVLAVREDVLEKSPHAVGHLIQGHFSALARFQSHPEATTQTLAGRLQLPPGKVLSAFEGLRLPDRAANRLWLSGNPSKLEHLAQELAVQMGRAALLPSFQDVQHIAYPAFIEDATP